MTLSRNIVNDIAPSQDVSADISTRWDSLYCSQLWTDSVLRKAIIQKTFKPTQYVPKMEYTNTQDCYIDKRKNTSNIGIDVYGNKYFVPNNHSTPNAKVIQINNILERNSDDPFNINDNINVMTGNDVLEDNNQFIPSISHHIDTSFRHKFSSSEVYCERKTNNSRIQKCGIKGIGCIVSLAVTGTPIKKRTQIQACSISIMIVAIVIISFVLVNFTSSNNKVNLFSTMSVPTQTLDNNKTSITNTSVTTPAPKIDEVTLSKINIEYIVSTTEHQSSLDIIKLLQKNIRTYPKNSLQESKQNITETQKRKEINNRDLSQRFCKCQIDEVCMLHEESGTSICRKAIDTKDPTGCGGLCALETEACQMVDRARRVYFCRLISLVTCSPEEWRCRNGLCVAAIGRCDGSIDCYDKSDEMYCQCDLTKQFRCGNYISCFSNKKICDGTIDCWDGHDEVNCTTECPDYQFTCTDGQCILGSRFCDGFVDCQDRSDEPHGCDASCGPHELTCRNHRCVPRSSRCDGIDQCGDASDELQCL